MTERAAVQATSSLKLGALLKAAISRAKLNQQVSVIAGLSQTVKALAAVALARARVVDAHERLHDDGLDVALDGGHLRLREPVRLDHSPPQVGQAHLGAPRLVELRAVAPHALPRLLRRRRTKLASSHTTAETAPESAWMHFSID